MERKHYTYKELLDIVEQLRGENGCPWDREQTHLSLVPHLLEESYELVEALQNADIPNVREELGDVLLQVIMHAQIAKEDNEFTIDEVIDEIATKLVYRHPHVFANKEGIHTADDVTVEWEKLKEKEKKENTPVEAMDRVAKALPALMRSQKVYKKAVKSNLVTGECEQVIEEVLNQLENLKKVDKNMENLNYEQEIGNLLFEIVKLSTFFDVNTEFALTKSVEKFINRFRYIEN